MQNHLQTLTSRKHAQRVFARVTGLILASLIIGFINMFGAPLPSALAAPGDGGGPITPQSMPAGGVGDRVYGARIDQNGYAYISMQLMNDTTEPVTGTVEIELLGHTQSFEASAPAKGHSDYLKANKWAIDNLPAAGTPIFLQHRTVYMGVPRPWETHQLEDERLGDAGIPIPAIYKTAGCGADGYFPPDPRVKWYVGQQLVASGTLPPRTWWSDFFGAMVDFTDFLKYGTPGKDLVVHVHAEYEGHAPSDDDIVLVGCKVPETSHVQNITFGATCVSQAQPNDLALTGVVTDQFGKPMSNVSVSLTGIAGNPQVVTNANGQFAFTYAGAHSHNGDTLRAAVGDVLSNEITIGDDLFAACSGGSNPEKSAAGKLTCIAGNSNNIAIGITAQNMTQGVNKALPVSLQTPKGLQQVNVPFISHAGKTAIWGGMIGYFGDGTYAIVNSFIEGARIVNDAQPLACGGNPHINIPGVKVSGREAYDCSGAYGWLNRKSTESGGTPGVKVSSHVDYIEAQKDASIRLKNPKALGERPESFDGALFVPWNQAVLINVGPNTDTREVGNWRGGEPWVDLSSSDSYTVTGIMFALHTSIKITLPDGSTRFESKNTQLTPIAVPSAEWFAANCAPQPHASIVYVLQGSTEDQCDVDKVSVFAAGQNWPADAHIEVTQNVTGRILRYVGWTGDGRLQFDTGWREIGGPVFSAHLKLVAADGTVLAEANTQEIGQRIKCATAAPEGDAAKTLREVNGQQAVITLWFNDGTYEDARWVGSQQQVPSVGVGLDRVDTDQSVIVRCHALSTCKDKDISTLHAQDKGNNSKVVDLRRVDTLILRAVDPRVRDPQLFNKRGVLIRCYKPVRDDNVPGSWRTEGESELLVEVNLYDLAN